MHDNFELMVLGVDGSRWPIHGRGAHDSVRLLEGALGDFYDAPISTVHKARVGQPGSSFLGSRDLERHVVLRVGFYGADWQRWESLFRRAFSPTHDAVLAVRTPEWGERRLTVRLEEHPQYEDSRDPYSQGGMVKKYVLIAHNPYWVEPVEYKDTFVFDGGNWASGSVTVDNPCDVAVWPRWTLTAPAKFGLGDIAVGEDYDQDRVVWLPYQAEGATALVDTDPVQELIVSNGAPVWELMNGQFFMHQIPAGSVDVQVPVMVDPIPLIPTIVDPRLRIWLAQKLQELVDIHGLEWFLSLTNDQLGERISAMVLEQIPEWLPKLSLIQKAKFTPEQVTESIRDSYINVSNLVGAEAQVHLERRWRHPWG